MSTAARVGALVAAVGLALGAAACTTVTVPTPSGPMMGTGTVAPGTDGDDGYGPMMGGRTTTPAVPHAGPVAGEGLDPAAVTALQAAVDRGAQPWRLEPRTVALAFTRARFGWMMPRTELGAGGTVTVDDGDGGAVSLQLAQPGRTGTTGVWTVTGGTWVR